MTLGNVDAKLIFEHTEKFSYSCEVCLYEVSLPINTDSVTHRCKNEKITTPITLNHVSEVRIPYRDKLAQLNRLNNGKWSMRLNSSAYLPHLDDTIIRRVDDQNPGNFRLGATVFTDGWDDFDCYDVEAVFFASLEEALAVMRNMEDNHVLTYLEIMAWVDELDAEEE